MLFTSSPSMGKYSCELVTLCVDIRWRSTLPVCRTLQQLVCLYDLTFFAKNKTFLKTKSEFVSYADES